MERGYGESAEVCDDAESGCAGRTCDMRGGRWETAVGGTASGGSADSKAGDTAVAVPAGGASHCGLCVEGGEGKSGAHGGGGDCVHGGAALVPLFPAQSARADVDGVAASGRR